MRSDIYITKKYVEKNLNKLIRIVQHYNITDIIPFDCTLFIQCKKVGGNTFKIKLIDENAKMKRYEYVLDKEWVSLEQLNYYILGMIDCIKMMNKKDKKLFL